VEIKFFANADRPFTQLVLRLNINQPGPEALNQIISKRGHLPGPDPRILNSAIPGDLAFEIPANAAPETHE
jgi:hypothetical protein